MCPSGESNAQVKLSKAQKRTQDSLKAPAPTNQYCERFQREEHDPRLLTKYFYFFFSEFVIVYPYPASTRGAYRDRHDTRGGDAVDVKRRSAHAPTNDAFTDGEVVWSWHPGADAK
ncbi:hypothetical protein [Bradyrhizobium sp. STM 3557]|uniref:hypothetical protein n=1 Tax=Bradyrhizobium sp. STM 3557 TaxID=578920 RepID=UPI00388D9992